MAKRAEELKREIRSARAHARRDSKECGAACWRVAVSSLCFCSGDTTAACRYARQHERSEHEPAALQARLEKWWAESSVAELRARAAAPNTAALRVAANRAQVFLTEMKLYNFVSESNLTLAMAPVTSTVIKEVHRLQSPLAEPTACLLKPGASRKSMKQRLRRW